MPEKQDFGSLQKEFDFQISFQLKGLKSSLQTYGVGRVLVLLLKRVPFGGKAEAAHGTYLPGAMAGGKW